MIQDWEWYTSFAGLLYVYWGGWWKWREL